MSSRLKMTAKNAVWSYLSMAASFLLQFLSRSVFIYYLGEGYLGINGLFSNVLGVLSFAELGIGTAINFSLYRPVAQQDTEKIKAYMHCYKWAYRVIALLVAVLGLALVPFLDILVTDPGDVGNITVYYLIYLFNTVTSYFVSYKYSLVNAEQKNYIYTNANLIISASTTLLQILSLLLWRSFLAYLLVAAVFGVAQKLFISRYFNRLYPYLREKTVQKLSREEKSTLISKVKALVWHKFGDVSVHQTDNIIVSAFVSTKTVGLLSNYNLLISMVSGCINVLFQSVTGSLGNMVATESKEYQHAVFRKYRFIGFWFYGFTAIALAVLSSPFVTLWIGAERVIDPIVVRLLLLDYYMFGHRICLNNIKSAAGLYECDRFLPFLQALVNLVASIVLVKLVGLKGVYIGTILQGALSTILRPILSYRLLFGVSSRYYFIDAAKYGGAVLAAYALCALIGQIVLPIVTPARFVCMTAIVAVVPNALFALLFHKTEEFRFVVTLLRQLFRRFKARKCTRKA